MATTLTPPPSTLQPTPPPGTQPQAQTPTPPPSSSPTPPPQFAPSGGAGDKPDWKHALLSMIPFVGAQLHQEHLINLKNQHEANAHQADIYEHLASMAQDDATRNTMLQAAYQIRSTNKVPKDLDLSTVLGKLTAQKNATPPPSGPSAHDQVSATGQQAADATAAQTGLTPPPGAAPTNPASPGPQALTPTPPPGSPAAASQSAGQVNAATPPPTVPPPNQQQQLGMGSQPGTPGGGFSVGLVAGVPPPGSVGRGQIPTELQYKGMTENQEVAGKVAETRAMNEENIRMMHEQMSMLGVGGNGGHQHFIWETGPHGLTMKPDLGRSTPGLMVGPDGKPYREIRYADGTTENKVEDTVARYQTAQGPDGQPHVFAIDRAGNNLGEVQGMTPYPPAAFTPQVTNTGHWQYVNTNDGLQKVWVSGSTTKQNILPNVAPPTAPPSGSGPAAVSPAPVAAPSASSITATPPPGRGKTPRAVAPAASTGGNSSAPGFIEKGLTPKEATDYTAKLRNIENTLDLANRVSAGLPLLNSLIDAKKIELQADPKQGFIKALINRSVPLSPQEAELAGDFTSLMEHINTLRAPLGATGFRSEEAFEALQAQRGSLMANPEVTRTVLRNTIRALTVNRDAIAEGLNKGPKVGNARTSTQPTPPPGRSNSSRPSLEELIPSR